MRVLLLIWALSTALPDAAAQQTVSKRRPPAEAQASAADKAEQDERPRIRRRERPEAEFHESFTETSIFKPVTRLMEGKLVRVDCQGKAARLHVSHVGRPVVFEVPDPKQVVIKSEGKKEWEFACGAQPPTTVTLEYMETDKGKTLYSLEIKTAGK